MAHELIATVRVELPDPASQPGAFAETLSVVSGAWSGFLAHIEEHEPVVTLDLCATEAPSRRRRRGPNKPKLEVEQPALPVAENV